MHGLVGTQPASRKLIDFAMGNGTTRSKEMRQATGMEKAIGYDSKKIAHEMIEREVRRREGDQK